MYMIIGAPSARIPQSTMKRRRKMVPWWNDEYRNDIKERQLSQQNLIDYQRERAIAQKLSYPRDIPDLLLVEK